MQQPLMDIDEPQQAHKDEPLIDFSSDDEPRADRAPPADGAEPPTSGAPTTLPVGARVEIVGVESRPEHNGQRATVIRPFDPVKKRHACALDNGEHLSLRPDRLRVLDDGRAGVPAGAESIRPHRQNARREPSEQNSESDADFAAPSDAGAPLLFVAGGQFVSPGAATSSGLPAEPEVSLADGAYTARVALPWGKWELRLLEVDGEGSSALATLAAVEKRRVRTDAGARWNEACKMLRCERTLRLPSDVDLLSTELRAEVKGGRLQLVVPRCARASAPGGGEPLAPLRADNGLAASGQAFDAAQASETWAKAYERVARAAAGPAGKENDDIAMDVDEWTSPSPVRVTTGD